MPLPPLARSPFSRAVDASFGGITPPALHEAGYAKAKEEARVLMSFAQIVHSTEKRRAAGQEGGVENDVDFTGQSGYGSEVECVERTRTREGGLMKSDTAVNGGATLVGGLEEGGNGGQKRSPSHGGGEGEGGEGRGDGQGKAGAEVLGKRTRKRQKIGPVRSIAESLDD